MPDPNCRRHSACVKARRALITETQTNSYPLQKLLRTFRIPLSPFPSGRVSRVHSCDSDLNRCAAVEPSAGARSGKRHSSRRSGHESDAANLGSYMKRIHLRTRACRRTSRSGKSVSQNALGPHLRSAQIRSAHLRPALPTLQRADIIGSGRYRKPTVRVKGFSRLRPFP